jgi:hypothetical protein
MVKIEEFITCEQGELTLTLLTVDTDVGLKQGRYIMVKIEGIRQILDGL